MKKLIICAGFVLAALSVCAQLGAVNNFCWSGNNNLRTTWGGYGFNNAHRNNYQTSYLYNYNGFSFNNNGVNISVNTPWGGGNISFPVNAIGYNQEYTYTTPKHVRDNYISTNNITIGDIDYSDPNLAMNRVNTSAAVSPATQTSTTVTTSTTQVYTRTLHWVKKVVPTTINVFVETDANGQAFYKTEVISNEQWVLE